MVGDQQDAPARDVLDAEDIGAEVLAVQEGDREQRVLGPLRIEAERVHAGTSERQRYASQAIVEGLPQEPLERILDRVVHGAEHAPKKAGDASAVGGDACERIRTFARLRDPGVLGCEHQEADHYGLRAATFNGVMLPA